MPFKMCSHEGHYEYKLRNWYTHGGELLEVPFIKCSVCYANRVSPLAYSGQRIIFRSVRSKAEITAEFADLTSIPGTKKLPYQRTVSYLNKRVTGGYPIIGYKTKTRRRGT